MKGLDTLPLMEPIFTMRPRAFLRSGRERRGDRELSEDVHLELLPDLVQGQKSSGLATTMPALFTSRQARAIDYFRYGPGGRCYRWSIGNINTKRRGSVLMIPASDALHRNLSALRRRRLKPEAVQMERRGLPDAR